MSDTQFDKKEETVRELAGRGFSYDKEQGRFLKDERETNRLFNHRFSVTMDEDGQLFVHIKYGYPVYTVFKGEITHRPGEGIDYSQYPRIKEHMMEGLVIRKYALSNVHDIELYYKHFLKQQEQIEQYVLTAQRLYHQVLTETYPDLEIN